MSESNTRGEPSLAIISRVTIRPEQPPRKINRLTNMMPTNEKKNLKCLDRVSRSVARQSTRHEDDDEKNATAARIQLGGTRDGPARRRGVEWRASAHHSNRMDEERCLAYHRVVRIAAARVLCLFTPLIWASPSECRDSDAVDAVKSGWSGIRCGWVG